MKSKDAAFALSMSPQLFNYWRKKAGVTPKYRAGNTRDAWYTDEDVAIVKTVNEGARYAEKHLPPEFFEPIPQHLWDADPDADIHYQRCTKCWKWVHVNDLTREATFCKACHYLQIKAWNAKNPEKVKEYRRKYRQRHPEVYREVNARSARKRRARLKEEQQRQAAMKGKGV
jgi:hypothetical protein